MRRWMSPDGFVLPACAAGFAGGRYAGLAKPSFNPRGSVFAPPWGARYLLKRSPRLARVTQGGVDRVNGLRLVPLVLNATWAWLLFGRHLIAVTPADTWRCWP